MDINNIRACYEELQGYLSQIPPIQSTYDSMDYDPTGNQINSAIEELNTLTGQNYNKFKIVGEHGQMGSFVRLTAIRSQLGGLIDRLHAQYFNSENRPFGGSPQTIISQNQNQTVNVSLLLDIQSRIDSKLNDTQLKPEEKSFLETIKGSLSGVNGAIELIGLIVGTASKLGVGVDAIKNLLGL